MNNKTTEYTNYMPDVGRGSIPSINPAVSQKTVSTFGIGYVPKV